MKKIIIYGAWTFGRAILGEILKEEAEEVKIIFADPSPKFWGTYVEGYPVIRPEEIKEYKYDKVVVGGLSAFEEIIEELKEKCGVPEEKIDKSYAEMHYQISFGARIRWLEQFSYIAKLRSYPGACAEVGVFNGGFAKHINRLFPDRKLYLFDTFEGFSQNDVAMEKQMSKDFDWDVGGYSSFVPIDLIRAKMTTPEHVIFKVGYFPETAQSLEELFVFVNLDVDLYLPTLEGLRFFYSRMVRGGVIVVHDYFANTPSKENMKFKGIETAVEEFSAEQAVGYLPLADQKSIAFIKQ